MSLLNKYRKERLLEKRLSRLENLILEQPTLEAAEKSSWQANWSRV